jgi:glucose/arabinose dehydrogenase
MAAFCSSVMAQQAEELKIDAARLYQTHCTNCHGRNMEGALASPLIKDQWLNGREPRFMLHTVMHGIPNTAMIAWSKVLSKDECKALVDYIIASQDRPLAAPRPFPPFIETEDYKVRVEPLVTEGFSSDPWAIEFVDDRRALITERRQGLRWMVDGKLDPRPIEGLPVAAHSGVAGMLDLALHPNYKENGWVYIAYVHPLGDPDSSKTRSLTRLIRGRVKGHRWVDQEDVFRAPDELHFAATGGGGSRILFHSDGFLYFSIGDTQAPHRAQDLDSPLGKTFRLWPDGSIPSDGPYVGEPSAFEGIFTIGHRNIQGIGEHPITHAIWATEHGPMGGDELNVLRQGHNYGWPVITYGKKYDGEPVSSITHKEGMEQPIRYWTPSPALCPLEFYTGHLFPKWKNHLFVGALSHEEIKHFKLDQETVVSEERFFKTLGRVRDIKTGPEGALYLVLNNPHAVVRLVPWHE